MLTALNKEQTNLCKAISIIMIVLHHWEQKAMLPYIDFLNHIGGLACAVFFFLSGYGLYKSYDKNPDKWCKTFLQRRITKIIIPFWCANILYSLYFDLFVNAADLNIIILQILGIKLINGHFWFLQAIIVLYLSLYISLKYSKKDWIRLIIMLIGTLAAIFVSGGRMGNTVSLFFLLGVVLSKYEHHIILFIQNRFNVYNTFLWILLCIIFISTFNLVYYKHFLFRILFLINPLIFLYLLISLVKKIRINNSVLTWIGNDSYYIYMMNCFSVILFLSINNLYNPIISLIVYLLFNILLSYVFHKCLNRFLNI